MHTLIDIFHVISCIGLIIIIVCQTTKSEGTSGATGLGWGTIGGKSQAALNMPVGIERILNPLTHWFAVTMFVTAILNDIPENLLPRVLPFAIPIYIIALVGAQRLTDWMKSRAGTAK